MKLYRLLFLLLIVVIVFNSCEKEDEREQNEVELSTQCNGHASLCDSTYDKLTFVMPHNAHAYTPVYSGLAANQANDIPTQLADGVRAFTFKTYMTDDSYCGALGMYVYHGFPILGCEPFSKILGQLSEFMEANPREVITIGIEGSAEVLDMEQSFKDADLDKYFHVQPFGDPWPTLGEMIDSDKRLVVFTARNNANLVDGFHDYWNFIVDNNYEAQQLSDFDCQWFRGNPNGGLYLFNHFITQLTPQPDSAKVINQEVILLNRVNECMQFHGRKPNFLHVDFYNYGHCLSIADQLNGVE